MPLNKKFDILFIKKNYMTKNINITLLNLTNKKFK